jgi:hypothetical protein
MALFSVSMALSAFCRMLAAICSMVEEALSTDRNTPPGHFFAIMVYF